MAKFGPKPILDERCFVPEDLDEAKSLFEALVAAGVKESSARAVVGTLATLPARYSDSLAVSMVRYRRLLARLDGPPWEGRRVDRRAVSSVRAMKRLRNHQPQGLRFPRRWARSAA